MSRELIERIKRQMLRPLSSFEIARDIIRLENIKPAQAAIIVDSMLIGEKGFYKTNDGRWFYQADSRAERPDFIFCKVFCNGNRSQNDVEVRLVECSHLQISTPLIFTAPTAMPATDLNAPVFMDGIGSQLTQLRRRLPFHNFSENPLFKLSRLLPKLFPEAIIRTEEDISQVLGQSAYDDASHELRFSAFIEQCLRTLELLRGKKIDDVSALEEFYADDLHGVDYAQYGFDADFVNDLPEKPGVYVMKSRAGDIIYVGKSKNLKRRLRSYLMEKDQLEPKLLKIRHDLYDIEIHHTGSDLEALLLEQQLIQSLAPQINRQIQIQARPFRQKERYSRILLLPHFQEDAAALVLFRPGAAVTQMVYPRLGGDAVMLTKLVRDIFFEEIENHLYRPADEEILVTWLAQHSPHVRSIDMRLVAVPAEAVRLVQDHLSSFEEDFFIQV